MSSMMKDMDKWMRNFDISKRACQEHALKALVAFRSSPRIKSMGDKIALPTSTSGWCVKIQMLVGERKLGVSFSIAPDRMGNRAEYDEIGPGKPPSTMEILLMDSVGDFSDLDRQLGYYDDIQSFGWDKTPGAAEGGFSEVIDELVRLRAVLDGNLSASVSSANNEAEEDKVERFPSRTAEVEPNVRQDRLDELEQIFLRGLELIRLLKTE
jgi:hypothetical protein